MPDSNEFADFESEATEDLINADDGICKECDGTGEHHGHLCKDCGGRGYR